VHRDVSPQNVFVTYDGLVKLVDFGVAKTLAASHNTRPGAIKGKLAYMAPEQLQRTEIDRRADVFAVGVMLWETVAARRMWLGMSEVEIVAHLAASRPLPPLPPDDNVPAELREICARALDVDPDRRYQTAADLEVALEGVLASAADSHTRNLGKAVSLAFDVEQADRQAFIERCVRQRASAQRAIIDDKTTLENELPDMDVTLAGPSNVPGSGTAPRRAWRLPDAIWTRRAAAVVAVVGVASAIALAQGGRKPPPAADAPAQAALAPHTATATADPPLRTVPEVVPVARSMPELASRPPALFVAGAAARDESARPRRRHRTRGLAAGDGVLPPSPAMIKNERVNRDPRH
jgi:serine/threonine-protein kinase